MSSKYRDEKTRELLRARSKMLTKPDFFGNVLERLLLLKLLIPKKAPELPWRGDSDVLITAAVTPTICSTANTLSRPTFN